MPSEAIPAHDVITVAAEVGELIGDRWTPVGTSKGSVMLMHGGGQRRHSWRRTGERLAGEGWTTYAFDARGHGDSAWAADGDYSVSAQVGDLRSLIDAIGERPVLVGASMGGMTSLIGEGESGAAGGSGGMARAIVLVDVVARLEPEGVERIQAFMGGAPDGFASLDEAADAIAAYNPHRPRPRGVEGLRKNLHQGADGRWRWHWDPAFLRIANEPEREIHHERAIEAARGVSVPTLLIRGGSSDIVSADGLAEMQELIPQAEAVEVAAGHMIAGDDNDVFTARLTDFLGRLA